MYSSTNFLSSGLAALALISSVAGLSAELLIHEPFEYERRQWMHGTDVPGEGIHGLDGGTGFSGPWFKENDGNWNSGIPANEDDYGDDFGARTEPLSYTDAHNNVLVTSGNQMRTAFGNRSWDRRTLTNTLGEPNSTVWLSFLAQAHGLAGTTRWAFVELKGFGDSDRIWVGNVNPVASGNWGIYLPDREEGAFSADAGDDYPMNVPTLFLVKLEFGDWDNITISVWLNPSDLNDEGALGEPVFNVVTDFGQLPELGVAGRYSTDFDEIRVATTFESALPNELEEPPAEAPRLAIARDGENVILSWPAAVPEFDLYSSGNLTDWDPVAEEPVQEGDDQTVAQPIEHDRRFFRLQQ